MSEQDAWHHRIKAAQRDLIARCGGIARAADIGEVSIAQMGRLNNPNEPDLMSARVKARLEVDAGFPVVTKAELELQGWSLMQNAERPDRKVNLHVATAAVVSEASDVMGVFAEAVKDGKITPAEAHRLMAEFNTLSRVLDTARLAAAQLLALAGGLKHD
ncbi:phage regulatory CII family protein [Bosea sp. ASV33]|uniref:phage regulatory CII family protein n=1 Tax=Bosea sp. ASV33 TaxID=2795106 RepID=UPI0018EA8EC1|nr:phage regulatory CII family protein [Bosea sp. ASV33]